jgi:hypothetical protein
MAREGRSVVALRRVRRFNSTGDGAPVLKADG